MMKPWIPVLCVVLIAGCSGGEQKAVPGLQARDDPSAQHTPGHPLPEFDGERSYALLIAQTALGPRNPGSPGHARCLDFLITELRSRTSHVRLQEFAEDGYGSEVLRLTNVIASFRPERQDRILLCAHWDTRPRAELDENPERRSEPIIGANDGASGVAVLLELARMFQGQPPPTGVDIVLLDGEDYGEEGDLERYLLGSRHFARTLEPAALPSFAILLDMVGDESLGLPREGNSVRFAPDIVDLIWNTARNMGVTEFLDETGSEIHDDHVPLNEAGIKAVDIIDFSYPDAGNGYWHTHQDTPEHCSAKSLAAVGSVIAAVVYGREH